MYPIKQVRGGFSTQLWHHPDSPSRQPSTHGSELSLRVAVTHATKSQSCLWPTGPVRMTVSLHSDAAGMDPIPLRLSWDEAVEDGPAPGRRGQYGRAKDLDQDHALQFGWKALQGNSIIRHADFEDLVPTVLV